MKSSQQVRVQQSAYDVASDMIGINYYIDTYEGQAAQQTYNIPMQLRFMMPTYHNTTTHTIQSC